MGKGCPMRFLVILEGLLKVFVIVVVVLHDISLMIHLMINKLHATYVHPLVFQVHSQDHHWEGLLYLAVLQTHLDLVEAFAFLYYSVPVPVHLLSGAFLLPYHSRGSPAVRDNSDSAVDNLAHRRSYLVDSLYHAHSLGGHNLLFLLLLLLRPPHPNYQ
jgi:hypothetical protein